jgi:hypothetical protein
MRRLPMGVLVPLLGLLLLATVVPACSAGDDGATGDSTTTSAPTTLPESRATTTIPRRAVTEVDVCNLVRDDELETVLEDAGPGEVTVTQPEAEEGEVPPLITGQCSWPTVDEAAMTLYYLAPTTAPDGPTHLQDVIDLEPELADGATITTTEIGCCTVGLLTDHDGQLREVAVAKGSALLYLVVDQEVDGRNPAATEPYAQLVSDALVRAPR